MGTLGLESLESYLVLFLLLSKLSIFCIAFAKNIEEYQVDLDENDLRMFNDDVETEGLVIIKYMLL